MTSVFKALQPGDAIAIVAPAGWVDPARLDTANAYIQESGFTYAVQDQVHLREGRFAGSDQQRLDGLHAAYADPAVKAIIAVRGGYGSQRIVDQINWNLIRANPKPLIGYSDITTLLNSVAMRTGQPGLLGPMLGDISRFDSSESWKHVRSLLLGEHVQPTDHPGCQVASVLVPGVGEGRLMGGNLAMLASDCGTPTQVDAKGAILILEDVNEDLYRFDRMLVQLKRAGVLADLRGVIVGDLVGVEDKGPPLFGKSAMGIIREHFGELGIPVVVDFPCGHGTHRTTLPLGVTARLEAGENGIRLTHAPLFS